MKEKSKGIVLNYIPYKESSIIARIYTLEHGLLHFIVHGVRSKKTGYTKVAYFQPLILLELVYEFKSNDKLCRLIEFQTVNHSGAISFSIVKSSIALFISEVLFKTIRFSHHDSGLFQMLENEIHFFSTAQKNHGLIPIRFVYNYFGAFGIPIQKNSIAFLNRDAETGIMLIENNRWDEINLSQKKALLDALVKHLFAELEIKDTVNSIEVLRAIYQ